MRVRSTSHAACRTSSSTPRALLGLSDTKGGYPAGTPQASVGADADTDADTGAGTDAAPDAAPDADPDTDAGTGPDVTWGAEGTHIIP